MPPYVLKKIHPEKYNNWKNVDGIITWTLESNFGWGDGETPPQISAINYHLVQALRTDLEGREYSHAVEIGCGYGRVTPWLSEFSERVSGVEPNADVLALVHEYHPEINTISAKAQNLPLNDDAADLLFTRSVLQHIPPGEIKRVTDEMDRVTTSDSNILICEETEGEGSNHVWPRTPEEYSRLLDGFELSYVWCRDAPAKTRRHTRRRMFFERK